jgi:hypothetical protein
VFDPSSFVFLSFGWGLLEVQIRSYSIIFIFMQKITKSSSLQMSDHRLAETNI